MITRIFQRHHLSSASCPFPHSANRIGNHHGLWYSGEFISLLAVFFLDCDCQSRHINLVGTSLLSQLSPWPHILGLLSRRRHGG